MDFGFRMKLRTLSGDCERERVAIPRAFPTELWEDDALAGPGSIVIFISVQGLASGAAE